MVESCEHGLAFRFLENSFAHERNDEIVQYVLLCFLEFCFGGGFFTLFRQAKTCV